MRTLSTIVGILSIFLCAPASAQLSQADVKGIDQLLLSSQTNDLQKCVDAGLRKLFIMRVAQVTKKSDSEVRDQYLTGAQSSADQGQLDKEIGIWESSHSPPAVANAKFVYCMSCTKFPPASSSFGNLTQQCFGNSMFAIDVLLSKRTNKPKVSLKEEMARARVPLPQDQVAWFIDEMYDARTEGEEFALSRELFSSCLLANNRSP